MGLSLLVKTYFVFYKLHALIQRFFGVGRCLKARHISVVQHFDVSVNKIIGMVDSEFGELIMKLLCIFRIALSVTGCDEARDIVRGYIAGAVISLKPFQPELLSLTDSSHQPALPSPLVFAGFDG